MHLLSGETADVPNGARRSLLELDALQTLVQVQSVIAAGGLQFSLFSHLN